MATTTRRDTPGRPTRDEFLVEVERAILDDRFDEFMPLDQYGPPAKAERTAARRANGGADKDQVNGQTTSAAKHR